jgi:hypothetical protein
MEIDGLMMQAYKIFLGHPGVMISLLTWAVIVTLVFTIKRIHEDMDEGG